MKIKIRRNGKYVYVIEALGVSTGGGDYSACSLMAHVRDITDHHSCVEMSEEGESAIHDFEARDFDVLTGDTTAVGEPFILVQLNDEMLHQCASLMGGAVDHFVNQLVEYLDEQGFSPVPA